MGSKKCPPPREINIALPRVSGKRQNDKEIKAVRSVSNPSLQSQTEEFEETVEVSISEQFNEAYMNTMYKKYELEMGRPNDFLPPEATRTVAALLETIILDENILFLAAKFSEAILRVDETFNAIFSACADRNPLKYAESKGYVSNNRLMVHIMQAFRMLKVIASALEEGKFEYVKELLDMIALCHAVMKVPISTMRLFLVRLIKNLIHFKMVGEDILPPFVYFIRNVMKRIDETMAQREKMHPVLLDQMVDSHTAPAREYFRELKKWRQYVLSSYKALNKPLQSFDKQIETENIVAEVAQVDTGSKETWKIITCLKKGYKFRKKKEVTYF